MGLLLRFEVAFPGQRTPHSFLPVLVLDEKEPLVLYPSSAHQRVQADSFGDFIGTPDPVFGAAGEVVPAGCAAPIGHLAAAKLLEVVWGRHAAGVEKSSYCRMRRARASALSPFGAMQWVVTSVLSTAMGRYWRICELIWSIKYIFG